MKTIRTPIQIVTIIFSVTMLAGYVVYSQRQQSRSVAASSKGGLISGAGGLVGSADITNISVVHSREFVASGSKSIEPVIAVRSPRFTESGQKTNALVMPGSKSPAPLMIMPGSKVRAPLIELQPVSASAQGPNKTPAGMIAPGSKSQAPVFEPRQVSLQEQRLEASSDRKGGAN